MSWNVYITRRIPKAAINRLQSKGLTVKIFDQDKRIPFNVLKSKIAASDALLCLLTDEINEAVLSVAKNLKIVANYAVGFNNIDVAAATRFGICVSNTPGVLTEATADLTFLLILGIARRIIEADHLVRDGKFSGWDPMLLLGSELTHKTLGIVGAGRIGSAVARRAFGFKMRLLYTDPQPNEEIEKDFNAVRTDLKILLNNSDFVTIHVPLSEATHHLINRKTLSIMKKTAYLVNTSRGPVVDEHALLEMLRAGQIAGAGLDVFEFEPHITPGLADLNNVILLPHIASATIETRTQMAEIAAQNILSLFEGKTPPNIVNPEVLKKK